MKRFIINWFINMINKYHPIHNDLETAQIKYGLEGLYILVTKTVIILTLAFFLNILNELFLFLFFYAIIRLFSFGLHLNSSIGCLIVSIISFIGSIYISKLIIIPIIIKIILGVILTTLIYIYSPADTIKRPIIDPNRRKVYKYLSMFISIILVVVSFTLNNNYVSNAIIMAIFLQVIMINPFTYKIFNLPYNNYKICINKEVS